MATNCISTLMGFPVTLFPKFPFALWALSIYVASHATSQTNSAMLINVTQSPASNVLSINGNTGKAGDTGFGS